MAREDEVFSDEQQTEWRRLSKHADGCGFANGVGDWLIDCDCGNYGRRSALALAIVAAVFDGGAEGG